MIPVSNYETGILIDGGIYSLSPWGIDSCILPASHGGPPWAKIDVGDYRPRKGRARQLIFHTTKGIASQRILPGAGAGGRDKVVADFWRKDPTHSAAQLVIDNDGSVACLCDIKRVAAYHATVSNDYSVGIEIYQELGGGIYQAAMESAVKLAGALCSLLEIPRQFTSDRYEDAPLQRMLNGGPDCVGIFGHRNNTHTRGVGDPGDLFFAALMESGQFEGLLYAQLEDIEICRKRQHVLRKAGCDIAADGICGPKTLAAARDKFGNWASVPLS